LFDSQYAMSASRSAAVDTPALPPEQLQRLRVSRLNQIVRRQEISLRDRDSGGVRAFDDGTDLDLSPVL
jgi:hypothetical protein